MRIKLCFCILAFAVLGAHPVSAQQYPPPTPTAQAETSTASTPLPVAVLGERVARQVTAPAPADSLPRTGLNVLILLLLAALLLFIGRALVRYAKRRRVLVAGRAAELPVPRLDTRSFVPSRTLPLRH